MTYSLQKAPHAPYAVASRGTCGQDYVEHSCMLLVLGLRYYTMQILPMAVMGGLGGMDHRSDGG